MSDANDAERGVELYRRVLAPLVIGGRLVPVRPLGPHMADRIARLRPEAPELCAEVNAARTRRMRTLTAVDELEAPGRAEWLLIAAFNDLLQLASPYLGRVVTSTSRLRLARAVEQSLALIPNADTLLECALRHVTVARLFDVKRIDTEVRWWVGSAQFHGENAPARLMAWRDVRRVVVRESRVPLAALADYIPRGPEPFNAALRSFLEKSPITDLATAARPLPVFVWGPASLTLVASRAGARMARRAMGAVGSAHDAACDRAASALAATSPSLAEIASAFVDARRIIAAMAP